MEPSELVPSISSSSSLFFRFLLHLFNIALKKQDLGAIENWIRILRDHYRLHAAQLDQIKDPEERHRRFVEINVVETCLSVVKIGPVQRKRSETMNEVGGAYPRIHGLTFDPKVNYLPSLSTSSSSSSSSSSPNAVYSLLLSSFFN